MTAPTDTATAPEAVTEAAPTTETTTPVAEATTDTTRKRRSLEDVLAGVTDESDRAWLQGALTGARKDAAGYRERAKAAEDARAEVVAAAARALGIEAAPPDPAVLAQQLNEQTAAARQAARDLAVYRAASTAGGDPNALLDSLSFVRSLDDVEPNDAAAITERVKAAVAANPALGVAPARRAPGHNPAAGSSANGAPDLESQIAAATKAGDHALVIHLQNQKLAGPAR